MEKVKVLFVCMGNICRSPTAEGVFTKLVNDKGLIDHFHIDSAGTHAYHVGKPPDYRAQQAALRRGVNLENLRARKLHSSDFDYFDHVLVMDDDNYQIASRECPTEFRQKINYLLDFAPHFGTKEVPDPYYGEKMGFEQVLDMVEDATYGFLEMLQESGKIPQNSK